MSPGTVVQTIAVASLLAGCASPHPFPPPRAAGLLWPAGDANSASPPVSEGASVGPSALSQATARAVVRMAESMPAHLRGARTLVTTVTDVNRISTAAPLGRTLAEHVATAWVAGGFRVKEIRMRDHLLLDEAEGELILSRKVGDVAITQGAELVIAGTYSAAAHVTYVSLKVLRASDSFVEAAVSFELPNTADVRRLLQTASR